MTLELPACTFCGAPVDTIGTKTGWMRGVRGWEERRMGGGANKIILRETEERYAHSMCIRKEQAGIHEHQGQLL